VNESLRKLINIAVVLLVALAFVLIPGGGPALEVALTLLSIAFFTAIAFLGYRLYREYSFTLDSLEPRVRLVLYGSIALAFLTFAASQRLFDVGGGGVLIWLAMLVLASFGVYWVYMQSRRFG
jgi:drug/metabolite transporter (DMT)-like permease